MVERSLNGGREKWFHGDNAMWWEEGKKGDEVRKRK